MTILVIVGSVRPRRVGLQIAQWLVASLGPQIPLPLETVDLRDWHLPADDEPHQPKRPQAEGYVHPHTRAWSRKIAAAQGFVFLTPQYNWGYPAALKNALDHLYHEWTGKPAAIISYGHRGGQKAAAQLREVLTGLRMQIVEEMPALPLPDAELDDERLLRNPDSALAEHTEAVLRTTQSLTALVEALPIAGREA